MGSCLTKRDRRRLAINSGEITQFGEAGTRNGLLDLNHRLPD
jgi:hypothetical protein